MSSTRLMPIPAKLERFLNKTRREQVSAIKASALELYRDAIRITKARRIRKTIRGNLAVPRVLDTRSPFYVTYRPDWDVDFGRHPELHDLSKKWVASNVENNGADLPRLYALILNTKQVMGDLVPGDFAELGVYRGNSAAVLAHYARKNKRSVFLFDTFEGFEKKDLIGIDAGKPHVFSDTSLDLVKRNVGEDSVVFVKGYFPDTVTDSIAQRRYAVVHLDCDLYEPIKAGLEFFYDRLSPGGLLIIHDYSNPCWEGTKRAVDEFLPKIKENVILIPDKSGTAIIRKSR